LYATKAKAEEKEEEEEERTNSKPCDFKYPQQPHRSEDADTERTVCVEESPDHLEQTACYHL